MRRLCVYEITDTSKYADVVPYLAGLVSPRCLSVSRAEYTLVVVRLRLRMARV